MSCDEAFSLGWAKVDYFDFGRPPRGGQIVDEFRGRALSKCWGTAIGVSGSGFGRRWDELEVVFGEDAFYSLLAD